MKTWCVQCVRKTSHYWHDAQQRLICITCQALNRTPKSLSLFSKSEAAQEIIVFINEEIPDATWGLAKEDVAEKEEAPENAKPKSKRKKRPKKL